MRAPTLETLIGMAQQMLINQSEMAADVREMKLRLGSIERQIGSRQESRGSGMFSGTKE